MNFTLPDNTARAAKDHNKKFRSKLATSSRGIVHYQSSDIQIYSLCHAWNMHGILPLYCSSDGTWCKIDSFFAFLLLNQSYDVKHF